MPIQHIIAGGALPKSLPDARECLAWRDDLSVGPVPATGKLEELSRIREAFWEKATPLSDAERDRFMTQASHEMRAKARRLRQQFSLAERDREFAAIDKAAEVVVWCGPNRRETLMLGAMLHFGLRASQVTLAQCGTAGVGAWNDAQLEQAFAQRSPCAADALRIWQAYTAPTPDLLKELESDLVARMLEEYPSAENGLSLMEERLLRLVDGKRPVVWVVAEALGQLEEPIGDVLLFEKLWDFVMGEAPLLEPAAASAVFKNSVVRLNALGRQVLAGERDYVECGTVDRWVGGVHLQGQEIPWRRSCAV